MAGIGHSLIDELYSKLATSERGRQKQNRRKDNCNTRLSNTLEADESNRNCPREIKEERKESLHGKFYHLEGSDNLEDGTASTSSGLLVKDVHGCERYKKPYPWADVEKFKNQHPMRQCQRRNRNMSRNNMTDGGKFENQDTKGQYQKRNRSVSRSNMTDREKFGNQDTKGQFQRRNQSLSRNNIADGEKIGYQHPKSKNDVADGESFGNQDTKGQYQRRNHSLSRDNITFEVDTSKRSSVMKCSQSNQNRHRRSSSTFLDRDAENQSHLTRSIGFKCLEGLTSKDSTEIISFLIKSNSGFKELITKDMRPDFIVLVVKVLAKVCTCEFAINKAALINISCQEKFLNNLENHIFRMPTEKSEEKKNKIPTFFSDLFLYFETVMKIIPNTATEKLQNVFINTDIIMEAVESRQKINLSKQKERFTKLNEQLQQMIKEREIKNNTRSACNKTKNFNLMVPPDDFREKSAFPTREELFGEETPFLRPNIVNGAYEDVEHYLDVQVRLLREDFVSPLREGISNFLIDSDKRKKKNRIDNIRIYKKVQFVNPKVLNYTNGFTVKFDPQKKMNIKWKTSKRFMFGSLLLFTNDNFKNILFGTVLQRDIKELKSGEVTVVLQQEHYNRSIFDSVFLMIESEIYFEPYQHVLKALQTLNELTFPMKKYIVFIQNYCSPPEYLVRNVQHQYRIDLFNIHLLNDVPWPNEVAVDLDKSQLKTFKAALTEEFVIIQGPPGTGKTYLGLRIVKVLLQNKILWNVNRINRTPILVVCYTNHALDQFMEGILSVTEKIVRVGGQSKSSLLERYNLREIKKHFDFKNPYTHLKREYHSDMFDIMGTIKTLLADLEELEKNKGIVSLELLKKYSVVSSHHCHYFSKKDWDEDNILSEWLLEGFEDSYGSGDGCDQEIPNKVDEIFEDLQDEEGIRLTMDVDPVFFDFGYIVHEIKYAVNLHELEKTINHHLELKNVLPGNHSFNEMQEEIDYLQLIFYYWNNSLKMNHRCEAEQMQTIHSTRNIWLLSYDERWLLYKYWLNSVKTEIRKVIENNIKEYNNIATRHEEIKQFFDLEIMQNSLVVGMTTTNAARLQTTLRALKPRIVIVEEAAEILESHIIASLTNHCEHLILIGDHQQLRPSPAVYKLALKYNFDISLFERMVKNGMKYNCLEKQHRMRPEIAKLISPTIYPNLENDSSVNNFSEVRGITKSLFFVSHNVFEEKDDESKSHVNRHEADFILALCRHLILQGYKPEEITVLATYKAQMFYMQDKQKRQGRSGVHITVVDNYQGEENRIILLTLVRSNEEAKIGFLKIENRVCVALSRAKEGLYIIGNMENLVKSSEIWPKIKANLMQQGSFGTYLTLRCEVHPDQFTEVNCEKDFEKSPEGGCSLLCEAQLLCGHYCESICHADNREHTDYKCRKQCERIPLECDLQHRCIKLCYETCGKCESYVKRTLPCGHIKDLHCYINYEEYKCHEKVKAELPNCGHMVEKHCYRDVATYQCPIPCPYRLQCGHSCTLNCHTADDPDHLEYKCKKPCTKTNAGCTMNHKCTKSCGEDCGLCTFEVSKKLPFCNHIHRMKCHEDSCLVECMKTCEREMDCGHKCRRKCYEDCGGCQQKVEKVIPSCGHKISTKCCEIPDPAKCFHPCQRKLSCGHGCIGRCGEKCIEECHEFVRCPTTPLCSHSIDIPCYLLKDLNKKSQEIMKFCKVPCEKMLSCEHTCKGTCGECMQGRIHVPCAEDCGRVLICGHACRVPCSSSCPPCSMKCGYKCKHSICSRRCGVPCISCKERCDWECEHLKCTKLCHELCNRKPCYEPCKKKLKCGHGCIGFCGDQCPSLCRICDEKIVKEIFFGNEDDDNARFVLLVDCGHIIESEALEMWLKQSDGEIIQKTCPRCKTPILQTERFMNYVKKTIRDLAKVKLKIFGDINQLNRDRRSLLLSLDDDRISHDLLIRGKNQVYIDLVNVIQAQLQPVKNKRRNYLSQSEIRMTKSQIDILRDLVVTLCTCIRKHALRKESEDSLYQPFLFMLEKVKQFTGKFNAQVTEDFNRECKRFFVATNLAEIESSVNFPYVCTQEKFEISYRKACSILQSIELYTDEKHAVLKDTIASLTIMCKVTLSDRERKEIVQAMGLNKGHWFKCPNGHIYCITECGGATQVAKCPDCGENIGGTDYHLLGTNRLASEMDGAERHAWPGGLY